MPRVRLGVLIGSLIFLFAFGAIAAPAQSDGGPQTVDEDGTAIPLRDDTETTYREALNGSSAFDGLVPSNGTYVETDDGARRVVFASAAVSPGGVSYSGTLVPADSLTDVSVDVVVADTYASVPQRSDVSVRQIQSSPLQFHMAAVRIPDTTYRAAALTREVDDEPETQLVAGVASAGRTRSTVLDRPGVLARSVLFDASNASRTGSTTDRFRRVAAAPLRNDSESAIGVVADGESFWTARSATLTGVIVTPNRDVPGYDVEGPVLVLDTVDDSVTQYGSVSALRRNAKLGDRVGVEASVVAGRVSIEETITGQPDCARNNVRIRSVGCVALESDVVAHSGIVIDRQNASSDTALPIAGLSNGEQRDRILADSFDGTVVGRYVDANRIAADVGGRALLIDGVERQASIDPAGVVVPPGAAARRDAVRSGLRAQFNGSTNGSVGPPTLPNQRERPQDPDGDGLYEDVDGSDGPDQPGILDVIALLDGLDSPSVQNNPSAFNFEGDPNDAVGILDVVELLEQVN
jgi:hypothetical protein